VTHLDRGTHRTQRIIFVRYRNTEDGHNRVADELLDCSTVTLDHQSRPLEIRGKETPEAFSVELLTQLSRSDDITKDRRDYLATLTRRTSRRKRRAAHVAETRPVTIIGPARSAADHERHSAL
jgi:hypothetical protein